jgi:putative effector of murein hydrolase LrgA (UPF0299 family)
MVTWVFLPIPAIILFAVLALVLVWRGTKKKDLGMRAAGEILLALLLLALPAILSITADNGGFSTTELWASILIGIVSGMLLMLGILDLTGRG